ncbi:unnamed protein product [Linum trigynum]|uniref:Hydrophobic seed protein domain-containing protein n=1 Tax=Linum trigynum TaxID=586398 RepID=A0AAV2FG75_9ROSI
MDSSSSKLSPPLHRLIIVFTLLAIIIIPLSSYPAAAQPSSSDQAPPPPPPTSELPGDNGLNTRCTIDIYRLAVCTPLVGLDIGSLTTRPCCGMLLGLIDMEATVCLCMALRANVLGMHLDIPLALDLVLSTCYTTVPHYFQCTVT